MFLGVTFRALGMHRRWGGDSHHREANARGVRSFLCHSLRILSQMLRWCLGIDAKCPPHPISPFQASHVPTPPPPPCRCTHGLV